MRHDTAVATRHGLKGVQQQAARSASGGHGWVWQAPSTCKCRTYMEQPHLVAKALQVVRFMLPCWSCSAPLLPPHAIHRKGVLLLLLLLAVVCRRLWALLDTRLTAPRALPNHQGSSGGATNCAHRVPVRMHPHCRPSTGEGPCGAPHSARLPGSASAHWHACWHNAYKQPHTPATATATATATARRARRPPSCLAHGGRRQTQGPGPSRSLAGAACTGRPQWRT